MQSFIDANKTESPWDIHRTERTQKILPIILENVLGDILEIGAHQGTTTRILCETGAKFNRHVFVIDPWDGRQEGGGETYNLFMANCGNYKNLTVLKHGSETKFAIDGVKDKSFAYILIDGLHTYEAVKSDLDNFKHLVNVSGVICVDDWHGPYGFSEAIRNSVNNNITPEYKLLSVPNNFIETYIVRCQIK